MATRGAAPEHGPGTVRARGRYGPILGLCAVSGCVLAGYAWQHGDRLPRSSGPPAQGTAVPRVYRAIQSGDEKTAVALEPTVPADEAPQVLDASIYYGQAALAAKLLGRLGHPLAPDDYARLLSRSACFGYTDCLKLLMRQQAERRPARGAAKAGFAEAAALSVAAARGHADVVAALLDAGVPPGTLSAASMPHDRGLTPLMLAVRYGQPEVARTLLRHGARAPSRAAIEQEAAADGGLSRVPGPMMDPLLPLRAREIMSVTERRRDMKMAAELALRAADGH